MLEKQFFRLVFLIIPLVSIALLIILHLLYKNESFDDASSKIAIVVLIYYIAASFIWSFYADQIQKHFK